MITLTGPKPSGRNDWGSSLNNCESTNPWDHDDFGGGEGIANPADPNTGPDAIDEDDDNDSRIDTDWDQLEEENGSSSDWDSDNDGILDEDDKIPTRICLLYTSPSPRD